MAVDGRPQQALEIDGGGVGEVEKLEADVAELADRIIRYRRTVPEQLKEAFSSLTSSEIWDFSSPSEAGDGVNVSIGGVIKGLGTSSHYSREDEATKEKLELLKRKTLANASAMEPLLKRMRDCISRIGSLNSSEDSVHPVFKA